MPLCNLHLKSKLPMQEFRQESLDSLHYWDVCVGILTSEIHHDWRPFRYPQTRFHLPTPFVHRFHALRFEILRSSLPVRRELQI